MASSDRDRTTVAAIKKLILDRRLTPGDPMPTESELMDTLDVSRSSVREAVRTLVALDILQVRHGTGTFVGGMSLRPLVEAMVFRGILSPGDSFDSLREVVEVRMGLDFALAPRVVESLAGSDATQLEAYVDGMTASAARNERFLDDDRAFHLDLSGRLDNRLYAELVAAFWDIHKSTAPSLGMVNRVVPLDRLRIETDELAASLAAKPVSLLRTTKRQVQEATEDMVSTQSGWTASAHLAVALADPEARAAASAYLAGRGGR